MTEHRRVALIVAVDSYEHHELNQLAAASADADALADVLGRPDLGGFEVRVVRNETAAVVLGEIEEFLGERRPTDLALLHFSGHGLKDAAGELHLAARNTSPNRLVSTAIDATRVNQLIRSSRAGSVVLFLDCCYGGAFERGMVARAAGTVEVQGTFDQKSLGGGRGRVVITASSAVQYAFEGRDLTEGGLIEPSVFTGAIVDGIRDGLADRDGDGYVGLAELYDYVYERVRSRTPHQTPSKWEYGLQGELVISRSPRRVVRAAQLPPELVEIMRHPYSAARLGAITELTRLLDGDDLGLATAAVTALGVMSEDDSRGVSAEAAAVLGSRAPALSVESFDFGQLTVGGPAVERNCQLSGPPLVEAAEVIASVPQLRARLDGRTLWIRVEPSAPGPLDTTVLIRSPLGDQRLYVRGEVRPGPPAPPPTRQRPWADAPPRTGSAPSPPQQPPRQPPVAGPPVQTWPTQPPAYPPQQQPAPSPFDVPTTAVPVSVPAGRGGGWLTLAGVGVLLMLVGPFLPARGGSDGASMVQISSILPLAVMALVAALTPLLLVPPRWRWVGAGIVVGAMGFQVVVAAEAIVYVASRSSYSMGTGPLLLVAGAALVVIAVRGLNDPRVLRPRVPSWLRPLARTWVGVAVTVLGLLLLVGSAVGQIGHADFLVFCLLVTAASVLVLTRARRPFRYPVHLAGLAGAVMLIGLGPIAAVLLVVALGWYLAVAGGARRT